MNTITVIIDNDSLGHLAYIDSKYPIVNCLRTIFSAIHIPDEILEEFEINPHRNPERQKIILEAYTSGKFFKKCSSFDSISKAFLQTVKGIDKGEAAAAAQYYKIHSKFIISEDKDFHEKIKMIYPQTKVIKLKHVFAILDIHGLIDNWAGCISLLHQRRPIKSAELRDAYSYICKMYGKQITKSMLSQKTGLKKLGIV